VFGIQTQQQVAACMGAHGAQGVPCLPASIIFFFQGGSTFVAGFRFCPSARPIEAVRRARSVGGLEGYASVILNRILLVFAGMVG